MPMLPRPSLPEWMRLRPGATAARIVASWLVRLCVVALICLLFGLFETPAGSHPGSVAGAAIIFAAGMAGLCVRQFHHEVQTRARPGDGPLLFGLLLSLALLLPAGLAAAAWRWSLAIGPISAIYAAPALYGLGLAAAFAMMRQAPTAAPPA